MSGLIGGARRYPLCGQGQISKPDHYLANKNIVGLIDNHDSGYLGMAVQLYVHASSFGTLPHLDPEGI